jgi:uncharacterized phage protein (TIGR01671 family)
MSREIKFKYIWSNPAKTNFISQIFTLDEIEAGNQFEVLENEPFLKDYKLIAIIQFTGIFDKNGKEIFENDIVCWTFDEKTKKEIVFHEGCFGHFNFMGINNEYSEFISINKKRAQYMIVCGNINQNPELLGGQDE